MESLIYVLIVVVILALIALLLHIYIIRQSRNLLDKGMSEHNAQIRSRYIRKAALMFNKDAMLAYACNNPDLFVAPKLKPFNYRIGLHSIPCVFANHYFAKGLTRWISKEQKEFMKRLYAFDGLEEDCDDLVVKCIKELDICMDDVTIIFMPCSNDVRFKKKFQSLSWKLQKQGYKANHMTYPYLSVRDHKNSNSSQDNLMAHVRTIIGVEKCKVIIIDDVLNTGKTFDAFAQELSKCKAKIVGAVFISKVFNPPKYSILTWLKIVFAR